MVASVQPQSFQTEFEQNLRQRLQAMMPDNAEWLQDVRLKAMSRFEALGLPTRRLEAWKYINLRPLMSETLRPHTTVGEVSEATLQAHSLGQPEDAVVRLVFVNGRFQSNLSDLKLLPEGVTVSNLQAACETQPELVHPQLAVRLDSEPDAFVALNAALFEDGTFVSVPDGLAVSPLIHVLYVTTAASDPRAAYPRNVFRVGKQARVELAIEHVGVGDSFYFNNSVQEFSLAEEAHAECTLIFSEAVKGWHLSASRATLESRAYLNLSTVTLSGQVMRHTVNSLLKGEQAQVNLNGLDVLRGNTEIYHHTVTEHWVPDCQSNQYYKGILDDSSKSEFNGMIFVAEGANGTDSQQLNKNLLLSDNARVWTRPQLQINADDVKCAHGATVGQLEKDQLFYLASRGLSRELAQSLLTYGFAEEVIQRIANPLVRQYLDKRVLNNLHRADAGLKRQLGV